MSERVAQRRGVAPASRACSASLTQVWAISSRRALLVRSLVLRARRKHCAALSWYSPGWRMPLPSRADPPITRQRMYGFRQFCDFLLDQLLSPATPIKRTFSSHPNSKRKVNQPFTNSSLAKTRPRLERAARCRRRDFAAVRLGLARGLNCSGARLGSLDPTEPMARPPPKNIVAAYDTRCRNTGSPRLLAYMGRYRSMLYMVAMSNLRGPSLGSGMGTSSKQPFTTADIRPLLPSSMAS